jgi:hypothetical protein
MTTEISTNGPICPPGVGEQVGDELLSDALAAHNQGWNIETYLTARDLGVTDTEITESINIGSFADYLAARKAGATHVEIISAGAMHIDLPRYAKARTHGATHDQFCEALRVFAPGHVSNGGLRGNGRSSGFSPPQSRHGILSYIDALRVGASHAQILALADSGRSIDEYVVARDAGNDHGAACSLAKCALYPTADW